MTELFVRIARIIFSPDVVQTASGTVHIVSQLWVHDCQRAGQRLPVRCSAAFVDVADLHCQIVHWEMRAVSQRRHRIDIVTRCPLIDGLYAITF